LDAWTWDVVMTITSLAPGIVQDGVSLEGHIMSTQPAPAKLSSELLEALRGIKTVRQYPKGALLFQQSYPVTGVYLVESGEVRVLLPTDHRQKQLLEVAGRGSILGLSECMSGEDYRVTAEAGDQTTAAFISQQDFLEFLRAHGDFCVQVVRLLSEDLHSLYHKFRSICAHPGRPRHRDLDEQLN
jgi:CRP/FNR family transcriptional regulator, cyclic AMP receptor protein